jgi:hypothetical protein
LRRFDGDHRVARVNRPTEFVRGLDRHDVAQLTDTEQCRDARHQVLAKSRRRAEDVRVVGSSGRNLRREHGGEGLFVRCVFDLQHALDALDRSRLSGTAPASSASTATSICAPWIWLAQVTHLAVAGLSLPFACSATMRILAITANLSA